MVANVTGVVSVESWVRVSVPLKIRRVEKLLLVKYFGAYFGVLLPTGCRILSCYFSSLIAEKPPYWHKIFLDKRIRNFDEMPTVGPVIEEYKNFKIHESYQRWVKDVGHVVKELFPDGSCCVHVYHKDDFKAVYQNDGARPLRKSHRVIAKYRQDRPLIYANVGLGPGLGAEWSRFRRMLPSGVGGKEYLPFRYELEDITNDFIDLIRAEMDRNGEIELLPLLYRWAFESKFLLKLHV
ncbi:hypothetical protein TNCV_381501 [Trichonephila clavipes]|uniref:Uncharacterized protein n=1 Tax=Trichonephila clavipes TaxID=2585209 RepID=A0A8X6SE06_TRICX|nr:hypothetical protein TNCV_381501 [Trichonephila clavipes]